MDGTAHTPLVSIDCPRCGAPAALQPPARPNEAGGWDADYACTNGHRFQNFSVPKRRPRTD